jgi:hypothetical protein
MQVILCWFRETGNSNWVEQFVTISGFGGGNEPIVHPVVVTLKVPGTCELYSPDRATRVEWAFELHEGRGFAF